MAGRHQRRGGYSRLLHLYLLRMPLLVVELGLQPDHLLGLPGTLVRLAALLLPPLLVVVQAVPIPLAVQLDVLVLRLWAQGSGVSGYRRPRPALHPHRGPEPPGRAAGSGAGRGPTAAPSLRGGGARSQAFTLPRPVPCPAAPVPSHRPGSHHGGVSVLFPARRRAPRPAAAAAAAMRAVPVRNCPGWKRYPAALWFLAAER